MSWIDVIIFISFISLLLHYVGSLSAILKFDHDISIAKSKKLYGIITIIIIILKTLLKYLYSQVCCERVNKIKIKYMGWHTNFLNFLWRKLWKFKRKISMKKTAENYFWINHFNFKKFKVKSFKSETRRLRCERHIISMRVYCLY